MDTSVTIIGIIFIAIIGIPLYFVFRSQSVNKAKIRHILDRYRQYHFRITETQNKKVLHLDPEKKGFLLMDFNYEPEQTAFIDLKEADSCRLVPTTEAGSVTKIEFEFQFKQPGRKESVSFYTIEKDQIGQICLYEDRQLAEKWQQLITDCISS